MRYDVVLLGETMLRLTPESFTRLEQADRVQVHVGGSESNTAVGLSRLGHSVAWLSRLTDNPLGRRIEQTLASHGVDTQSIVWTASDRVGLYFLENGSPPRSSQVIYDRVGSAYSRFTPSDLPRELFSTGVSKWLHVTGISLWLNETVRDTIATAVQWAREAGWKISFDVNHRSLLCNEIEAQGHCQSLFEIADLAFLPRRDAVQLWRMSDADDDETIMKGLLEMRSGKPTVMTLGSRGAMASDGLLSETQMIEPVDPIGRLGGGDAFSAGFLSGWLETSDVLVALRRATAMARLKYSIPGDLPLVTRAEVEKLAGGANGTSLIR